MQKLGWNFFSDYLEWYETVAETSAKRVTNALRKLEEDAEEPQIPGKQRRYGADDFIFDMYQTACDFTRYPVNRAIGGDAANVFFHITDWAATDIKPRTIPLLDPRRSSETNALISARIKLTAPTLISSDMSFPVGDPYYNFQVGSHSCTLSINPDDVHRDYPDLPNGHYIGLVYQADSPVSGNIEERLIATVNILIDIE